MKTNLVTLEENALITEAIDKMEQYGIRRIPVVRTRESAVEATGSSSQRVVGVLSLDDLTAAGAIEPVRLARIIQRQLHVTPLDQAGRTVRYIHTRDGKYHAITSRNTLDGPRTRAHTEQTLVRFYKEISRDSGIPQNKVHEATEAVLGALLRRIPWGAASHLIAQLPRTLQEEMYRMPAGPDRAVTVETLLSTFSRMLNITDAESDRLVRKYIHALSDYLSRDSILHLARQLPFEFRHYFPVELQRESGESEFVLLPPQTESMEIEGLNEPVRAGHPEEGERKSPVKTA
jgi:IMP dehydrogenase